MTTDQSTNNPLFPPRKPLTSSQISSALRAALTLQETASNQHSKRPFGSVLLGPDNETILLSHYSLSHVRHSETQLARLASDHFPQSFLWQCTLVSTWEPCVMCAGTMYWANIGGLVYGAGEDKLRGLTGEGNSENMTLDLGCRSVFERGQKDITVVGPVEGWEEKVVESAKKWWDTHK